jgi:hypothetical protein
MDTESLPAQFLIAFGEHIPASRVSDMSGTLASFGAIRETGKDREFEVTVSRANRLKQLKLNLEIWDAHGFIIWKRMD